VLAGRLPAVGRAGSPDARRGAQRFAIPAEALDVIRGWTEAAGVRWGADAAHRVEERLPPCGDNTWRFGLDRLLLGTALPSVDAALWQGTLPSGDLEGSEAELLGQFVAFVETLTHFSGRVLATAHPAAEWRDVLGALLAGHDAPEARVRRSARTPVLGALALLADRAERGGFVAPTSAWRRSAGSLTTRSRSRPRRSASSRGGDALRDGCRCALVPFRVVALVGLSDGVFPRARRVRWHST
jgi:exodeoxyribonuclease V gamma subunit